MTHSLLLRRLVQIPMVVLLMAFPTLFMSAGADPNRASAALADILFDMDLENVSYALRTDGFVDITFGAAVSNADYQEAIQRMRDHPDIPGVLAGRGSANYCPLP
ncbi:MAG: hypothetical protein H6981_05575 [Gammaproteobacteria bacterium]|nr:hypothetical protein [Gammaproteobacteria bacterium]MCP5136253.1 hypothetical protein [Gammaproteobacteria bacterium]